MATRTRRATAHDSNQKPDYARRSYWGGKHLRQSFYVDPQYVSYEDEPPRDRSNGIPLQIERIRLNSGGYTSFGRYFGQGDPLFHVTDDEGDVDFHVRAADRNAAKREVLRMYPQAKLGR